MFHALQFRVIQLVGLNLIIAESFSPLEAGLFECIVHRGRPTLQQQQHTHTTPEQNIPPLSRTSGSPAKPFWWDWADPLNKNYISI